MIATVSRLRPTLLAACSAAAFCACAADGDAPPSPAAGFVDCADARTCAADWSAARAWVQHHSELPLLRADARVIATYPGWPAQDPRLMVGILREPLADGRERIRIEAGCAYDFPCVPDGGRAVDDFSRAMAAVH